MNHAELEERQLDLAVQPEDDSYVHKFLKPQWLQYFADDETTPENWNSFIEVLNNRFSVNSTLIGKYFGELNLRNGAEAEMEILSLKMFKPEVKKMKKPTELVYEITN